MVHSHWSHTVMCALKLVVVTHFSVSQTDAVPCTSMSRTYFLDKEFVPSMSKSTQVSCRCDTRRTADTTDFSPSSLLDAFTVKKWFLNSMFSTSRKPRVGARAQGGQEKKPTTISFNFIFPESTENWYNLKSYNYNVKLKGPFSIFYYTQEKPFQKKRLSLLQAHCRLLLQGP